MEKEEHKWEQGLEEDDNEEETLKIRRSRARTEGSLIGSAAAAEDTCQSNGNGSCETNGHMIQPSESVAQNGFDDSVFPLGEDQKGPENIVALSHGGVEEVPEFTEGHPKSSDNCVYYDKDEGLWKCRICCWTYGHKSLCINLVGNPNGHLHELMIYKTLNQSGPGFNFEVEAEHIGRNPDDEESGVKTCNFTVPKGLDSEAYQRTGNQKDDSLSLLHSSEIVLEEHGTSYKSSKIREVGTSDVDVINESDLDVAEFDVEKVLQNQNTHDLYCPNCNSCITRRVILRKRKRHVRNTTENVKRNKQQTAIDSKIDDSSGLTSNDLGHETTDIQLDVTSDLATNDYERDREPDIFRCLSCFSIFIPTGNGFKLFKIFGDKGKKAGENLQKSTTNKNWISSIFASDKEKTSMRPGSGIKEDAVKKNSDVCMPSSDLNDQNGRAESQKNGDKVLDSSKEEELVHKNLKFNLGDNSSDLTKDLGDSGMNNYEGEAGSQPSTPDISKEVPECSQIDQSVAVPTDIISFYKEESPKDTVPVNQPDGFKLLISSNAGSTIIQKLQTDHNPDLAIQKNDNYILSSPTTLSTPKAININGKTSISVGIFHEHEPQVGPKVANDSVDDKGRTLDDDRVSPVELSQHMINKNTVEIHAGEHLKMNKDTLVLSVKDARLIEERQANIAKDLKKVTVEHTAGKDTIIVVESGPITTAALERVQDLNAPTEIETSPHLAANNDAVDVMVGDAREAFRVEIIKSIVYGGLAETIASLGVVSSAAGGGTATINILALAMANLISGLVFTYHNLRELKKGRPFEHASNQVNEQADRYEELLGRRENFVIHATVAVLSFLLFGLIPPITYGFSFRASDDRDLKLLAVGAASLVCIILLATAKEHVRRPPKSYLKTVMYYVLMGFMVSGISYAAGELIKRLLEKLRLFQSNSPVALLPLPEMTSGQASY